MKCLSVSLETSLPGFVLLDKQLNKQTNKQKLLAIALKKKKNTKNLILD